MNGEARYKYSVEKIFEVTRLMNSDSDSAWNSLGQWSVPRTILATNVIRNFKVAGKTDNDELGSTLSELGINTGLELLVPEKVVWEWLNINTEHQLNINNDYQSADDYVDLIEESLKDAGLAYEIGDELDQDEIDELIENGQQVTKEFGSCDFGAEKLKKVNALVKACIEYETKIGRDLCWDYSAYIWIWNYAENAYFGDSEKIQQASNRIWIEALDSERHFNDPLYEKRHSDEKAYQNFLVDEVGVLCPRCGTLNPFDISEMQFSTCSEGH